MRRYDHNLSFAHSLSLNMGYLVPLAAVDVLPGDTFIHGTSALVRVAPLAKPVMHLVDIRVHHWFVPNRIVWDDWEEFIVGNEGGVTYPTVAPTSAAEAAVYDHMGVEPVTGVGFDALPLRAYNLIFNEFYRDQDLVTARTIDLTDGVDTTTARTLAQIAWGKDYFTTARSTPQQGTAVDVAFSAGTAPVLGVGWDATNLPTFEASQTTRETGGTSRVYASRAQDADAGFRTVMEVDPGNAGFPFVRADLSQATGGIDINDLRRAVALQRIAEARSFFGSRYADFLRFYGVNPRDGRLQRPEYLGGGKAEISFSEVLATAEGSTVDVGDLFGHGISGLRTKRYRKMFEEHGWMITLMSVRPKGVYQNGIPRRFLRREPTDFWHRELELLPWQSVTELELFAAGSSANIFGYTPRFEEYRETPSYVSGTFRGGTEEDWTLAREFASAPTLNSSFITCTPSDRIYQDTSMPELLVNSYHDIRARRLVARHASLKGVGL